LSEREQTTEVVGPGQADRGGSGGDLQRSEPEAQAYACQVSLDVQLARPQQGGAGDLDAEHRKVFQPRSGLRDLDARNGACLLRQNDQRQRPGCLLGFLGGQPQGDGQSDPTRRIRERHVVRHTEGRRIQSLRKNKRRHDGGGQEDVRHAGGVERLQQEKTDEPDFLQRRYLPRRTYFKDTQAAKGKCTAHRSRRKR
jgi:hypothetical protein